MVDHVGDSAVEFREAQRLLCPREMDRILLRTQLSSQGAKPCRLVDAKFQPARHCIALFSCSGTYVTAAVPLSPDSPFHRAGHGVVDDETGVRLFPFPEDPALPGLALAADSRSMARLVGHMLTAEVISCRVLPVRYRPCQRCTFRVDVLLETPDDGPFQQVLFAKVYDDPAELETVYSAMGCLTALHENFRAATPLGRAAKPRIILQNALQGCSLEELLDNGHAGPAIVRCATAIAAVHGSSITVGRSRNLLEELDELSQWARDLGTADALLSSAMASLVESLLQCTDVVKTLNVNSFTHGDFKPNQILVDGKQPGLLDFDGCAMSDPALDVATFVSTLRQITARRACSEQECEKLHLLEEAFVRQYCALTSQDGQFRRKALRAFYRDPSSPLPAVLVEGARLCVRRLLE
jgi:hypothetical protein